MRKTYNKEEAKVEAIEYGHQKKALSKVIRAKCLDCCIGQLSEVKACVSFNCDLWPYRMGKNPFTNRSGQKDIARPQFSEQMA
tara:strand:+ start:3183 stop:3431 length:249 start_codon:yes stop_codon:yes gene_type:complete